MLVKQLCEIYVGAQCSFVSVAASLVFGYCTCNVLFLVSFKADSLFILYICIILLLSLSLLLDLNYCDPMLLLISHPIGRLHVIVVWMSR